MKKIIVLTFLLCAVVIQAQTTITKVLENFSELKVYNGISITIKEGKEQKLIIEGEKADKVKVSLKKKTLRIAMRFPETMAENKVTATLFVIKPIGIIDANEGAVITGKILKQNKIEIKAQEGAFINLVTKVKKLKVKSTTGAVIKLSGKAMKQEINTSLGASYKGYALEANTTMVKASSGAKAEVQAASKLQAKVSFGGSVFYKGNPSIVNEKKVMGGVIEQQS